MNHFFVAGFDFGTSYSKVVLRDQLFKRSGKAVTFGGGGEGLFPSFVWCDGKNIGSPVGKPFGEQVPYLKLLAADSATERPDYSALYSTALKTMPAADLLLTAFFASVISGILEFIANDSEWDDFVFGEDILVIQLAVPTGMMERRDGKLEQLMKSALKAAYFLVEQRGVSSERLPLKTLRSAYDKANSAPEDSRLDQLCIIYPEVAAGVQTIFRSRNLQEGKYITMDVGAGTVDLNVFSYFRATPDAPRRLNYWSCQVVPLGCSRLPSLHEDAGSHERTSGTLTPSQVQSGIGDAITSLMNKAFEHQPRRTPGDGPDPWTHSVQCYVFGGGARNQLYIDELWDRLQGLAIGISVLYWLPKPSEGFALPDDVDQFGRFAVSYGLSFHAANLEEVRLPSELQTFVEAYPDHGLPAIPPRFTPCTCYSNPDCVRCLGTGFLNH